MAITIYYNPDCSKCKYAIGKVLECNTDVNLVEYLVDTPTKEELKNLIHQLGIRPEELVRKSEQLYQSLFVNRALNDEEWVEAMVNNPVLIQRPIIVKEGKAVIARDDERINDILK